MESHAAPKDSLIAQALAHGAPLVFEFALLALLMLLDGLWVAQLAPEALPALSLSLIVVGVLVALLSTLAAGGGVVVAGLAERQRQRARDALWLIALTMGLSGMMAGAGLAVAPSRALPALFSAVSAETLSAASGYLGVLAWALPFRAVHAALSASMIAEGNTRGSLIAAFALVGTHLVALTVLAGGSESGALERLALCHTVAAIVGAVSALWCAGLLRRHDATTSSTLVSRSGVVRRWAFVLRRWAFVLRRWARVLMPMLLCRLALEAGFFFAAFSVSRLGDAALSANHAVFVLEIVFCQMIEGVAWGVALFGARLHGADDPRLVALEQRMPGWLTRASLLPAFAMLLGSMLVARLFRFDAPTAKLAAGALAIAAVSLPALAYASSLRNLFLSTGRARDALAASVVATLAVRIPLCLLAMGSPEKGLLLIWLAAFFDHLVTAGILRWRASARMGLRVLEPLPARPALTGCGSRKQHASWHKLTAADS